MDIGVQALLQDYSRPAWPPGTGAIRWSPRRTARRFRSALAFPNYS